MTNEEKAEEICRDYNYTQFLNDGTYDTFTESAVLYMLNEMAKWKEQQVIDKAVDFFYDQLNNTNNLDCNIEKFINDFKQTMQKE